MQMGKHSFSTTLTMANYNKIYKAFFAVVSLIVIYTIGFQVEVAAGDDIPFRYIEATGKGPSKWGQLDPKWRACGVGQIQSPIDVADMNVKVYHGLGELQTNYKLANATIVSRGRDIMVAWKGDAGSFSINGTTYSLQHIHWHTPSEHAFNGTRYDLELHIVHAISQEQMAVIGILYQYGQPDPFLSKLLPYIKSVRKEEKNLGMLNLGELAFMSRNYYRYNGSLSVPPCTEGVIWTVLEEVRTVSLEQVQALTDAVDAVSISGGFK